MTLTREQKDFLDYLRQSLGVVTIALQASGIKRDTYEDWLENPLFEEEVEKVDAYSIDFVENQLIKEIRNGNMSAIQYYLKTKAKDRGYN